MALLSYARRHRKYAALTGFFGSVGFALAFVYPWIIGSTIDLITKTGASASPATLRELWWLTAFGGLTALLHAAVLYGRGHSNVHLGDSIITELRRDLFAHLQKLSVGFYARERTGSILSRIVHDVHEATAIIYGGVIVAALDAAQLLIAFALLLSISWKIRDRAGAARFLRLYGYDPGEHRLRAS